MTQYLQDLEQSCSKKKLELQVKVCSLLLSYGSQESNQAMGLGSKSPYPEPWCRPSSHHFKGHPS